MLTLTPVMITGFRPMSVCACSMYEFACFSKRKCVVFHSIPGPAVTLFSYAADVQSPLLGNTI